MNEKMVSALYLHALTPVHAGTGQVSASVVDLPVAREKATNWPVLPATSLKGVLKDAVKDRPIEEIDRLFGSQDRAGTLQFGDARLLCFPIRSWQGVFAYVTCPLALNRLKRDFIALGAPVPFSGDVPSPTAEQALLAAGSVLSANDKVWLEDLELNATMNPAVEAIAKGLAQAILPEAEWPAFISRFVLLPDDIFDFLTETATEITARIALKQDTKTVRDGGLWYEESVPAEAIFVAPVRGGEVPVTNGTVVQIGGNESVGRGLCRVMVAK